ncbi:MAG: hypothetical protein FWH41_00745 [Treponema sp.]|nr:hypothetical protein [Treponema sp.]
MKKQIKVLFIGLLAAVLVLLLPSCDYFLNNLPGKSNNSLSFLDEGEFYAQNMNTRKFYVVKANLLAEGDRCAIWAEKGSAVTNAMANDFAAKFDNVIRPKMVNAFSEKNLPYINKGITYNFDDILDYANWLAGRDDNKLTILLLDIKDEYKKLGDTYVAGYFSGVNFLEQGRISGTDMYSNGRDMIYIDTKPGLNPSNIEKTYATFAHELQHLMNFASSEYLSRPSSMDLWINEGLSSQAEHIYLNGNPKEKCEWFRDDRNGTIAKGNNFFVWDNHAGDMAILDEYATVYLFFRWLYLQADAGLQEQLFKNIINSSYSDYRSIIMSTQKINASWDNWETVLKFWFAANHHPSSSNFGYKNDDYIKNTIKVHPIDGTKILLAPGEGVYSIIDGPVSQPSTGTGYIRYAGLDKTNAVNTVSPFNQDMLLTFNANSNKNASSEQGNLTGTEVPVSASISESANLDTHAESYVMDAWDILGRGNEEDMYRLYLKNRGN